MEIVCKDTTFIDVTFARYDEVSERYRGFINFVILKLTWQSFEFMPFSTPQTTFPFLLFLLLQFFRDFQK